MLTHYFDIVPQSEYVPLPRAMTEIMQILHVYMLRGKKEGRQRALGFPAWGASLFKLGGIVRVFGEEEDLLQLRDVLNRKHGDYFSAEAVLMYVRKVPDDVKGHAAFFRKRLDRGGEGFLRRLKRKNENLTDERLQEMKKAMLRRRREAKTPFLYIESSKKFRIPFYIDCRKSDRPVEGNGFGGYGLARFGDGEMMSTVPMF